MTPRKTTIRRVRLGTAFLVPVFFLLPLSVGAVDGRPRVGQAPENLGALVDNYIRSFPPREEFNGVILVADGDRILVHKGYGWASREFGVPNGPQTRFQIGSITKAFTSMLALKLVEEGRLDLDKTISDYLPYYPEQAGRRITVRQLLSNTSGIPHHYQVVPDYFRKDDHYFHTPRELIGLFWNAPLRNAPGERFTYSSPGYYIVGVILQQVAKESYAELLRRYIFGPLGMKNTYVENNRTTDLNLATGYIRGLWGPVKAYVEDKSTALAAGDITGTASDLYLWQKTLSRAGDRILTARSKEILFQPVLADSPMTMAGPHFNIPYDDGKKTLALSILNGSSSGYMSCLARQTEDDRCVIVLSNINGDDVGRIADDIGDMFLRRILGLAIGPEAPLTRTPPSGAKIPDPDIEKVLGFYRNRSGNIAGIVRDGGKLFYLDFAVASGLQAVMELIPVSAESFYLSHNTSFRCTFARDEKGAVTGLSASRNGRVFNQAERCGPGSGDLSDLAGFYTSVELQKTFHLETAGQALKAEDFLGEAGAALVPLEKDVFGFDRGFIRFERDREGLIDGFEVFTKNTDGYFGSRFIKTAY
jgi:CubicO group peptidase (beta-lactamase class C family)